MKVNDFAKKLGMSSCDLKVVINKGMETVEIINSIRHLKTESSYLDATINYFIIKEDCCIIQIRC